jgi:nitroreductase
MSDFDLGTVDRLLSTTRAVRRRLDLTRPVPREVVLDCIRLSQQAPTASNTQQWRWVLVDDPSLRRELGAIYARGLPAMDLSPSATAEDDQTRRVHHGARWLAEHLGEVPMIAVACIEGRLAPESPTMITSPFYGSIYPAIWSFQLALRSRGLGSTLTTLHLLFEEQVAGLLGIPAEVTQVAMLPVAYTVGLEFRPADRPAAETIVSWNRWDDPDDPGD